MKVAPPKWRVMLYCGIALFIASVFIFGEPLANGRFLSSWLHYGTESNYREGVLTLESVNAEAAISKIGTRAIPTLLDKLDSTDSASKQKLAIWQERAEWLPKWIKIQFRWAEQDRAEAIYGFSILNSRARSAVPALSQRLSKGTAPEAVALCLVKIGTESLSVLKAALTNKEPSVRCAALHALETDQSLLEQALPELRLLTRDTDEYNAAAAFFHLNRHSPSNEGVIYLKQALGDTRIPVVKLGLARIRYLGTNARPFIPELSNLLTHPRPSFRYIATNALKTIDPVIAFAGGVNTNPPPPNTNWGPIGRRGARP